MPAERCLRAFPPDEQATGTLELGVEPELTTATQTWQIPLTFDEQGVKGSLTTRVSLPGPVLGDDTPYWSPVVGTFPAPDDGCEVGTIVSLDAHLDVIDDTPRAAYEAARARLPAEPIRAAWEDPLLAPGSLTWTEVTLTADAPAHACFAEGGIQVYTSLHIESADGLVEASPPIIARVGDVGNFQMLASPGWMPSAEFVATHAIRDLDLSLDDYGGLFLYQTFHVDEQGEQLAGELDVMRWETTLRAARAPPCTGAPGPTVSASGAFVHRRMAVRPVVVCGHRRSIPRRLLELNAATEIPRDSFVQARTGGGGRDHHQDACSRADGDWSGGELQEIRGTSISRTSRLRQLDRASQSRPGSFDTPP